MKIYIQIIATIDVIILKLFIHLPESNVHKYLRIFISILLLLCFKVLDLQYPPILYMEHQV